MPSIDELAKQAGVKPLVTTSQPTGKASSLDELAKQAGVKQLTNTKPTGKTTAQIEKEKKYQESAENTGALFPASPVDKVSQAPIEALKAVGNIPSSAWNLVKGIVSAVDPRKIVQNVQTAGKEFQALVKEAGSVENARKLFAESVGGLAVDAIKKLRSLTPESVAETVQRTAVNDPLLIPSLFMGGASATGKTRELAKATEMVTAPVAKTVSKTATAVSDTTKAATKYGMSQATGLRPETIANIVENPARFSPKAPTVTREGLGDKVFKNIQAKIDELSETGKAYETVRKSGGAVRLPKEGVANILEEKGILLGKDGKLITSAESIPLTGADKAALQEFLDVFGKTDVLSSNAFLNARKALSKMSEYDAAKSDASSMLARELRSFYDDFGKGQLKGLKEADAKYAPQVRELNQLKKDYVTKDPINGGYMLKDSAFNKISNLTGKGKEQVLNRLEKLSPGITEEIKILKSLEDIDLAQGQKVGTYLRSGVGAAGVATGNVPAIIGAILSSPQIAVKALRAYGTIVKTSKSTINKILNKFKLGGKLSESEKALVKRALERFNETSAVLNTSDRLQPRDSSKS